MGDHTYGPSTFSLNHTHSGGGSSRVKCEREIERESESVCEWGAGRIDWFDSRNRRENGENSQFFEGGKGRGSLCVVC